MASATDTPSQNNEPDEYFRFFREIGIISQLTSTRADKALPHGLTLSQFSVLSHFTRGMPPKTPLELANAFQVTKGAMTNTVAQLKKKGFVDITPHHSDGRSKIVSVSEAGKNAYYEGIKHIQAYFEDFVQEFDLKDIQAMIPKLEEIRIWLDDNRK